MFTNWTPAFAGVTNRLELVEDGFDALLDFIGAEVVGFFLYVGPQKFFKFHVGKTRPAKIDMLFYLRDAGFLHLVVEKLKNPLKNLVAADHVSCPSEKV
jgi:hypothetical protein